MIDVTMVLTINGTTRSERAGGLDNGEVNRFTTKPGEYRHDLHTIEDVIENIAEKAYQRGEWVSSIELDGENILIAMVVEKLQENILNVSATVDALASIGFFAAADLEDLTSWVNGVNRDNFGSSDLSDLAYKTAAWVQVQAQTFEQLEAASERKDYRTAFVGFKKLAEQGHAGAQNNLGVMYASGEGVPKGEQRAAAWFRKAAEQGDASAQFNLGNMYRNGQGMPKDEQQAVAWYRKAAEQGDASAQNSLGVMYANGWGVPKDEQQAAAWYRKAAEQGHAIAQNNLGAMYDTSQGVPKDDRQAAAWYMKAAEQGDASAQFNLGVMYANGEGVPKDEQQAMAWYMKAAEQGVAMAQTNLGLMYANGEGVPKDEQSAYVWWLLASAQGDQEAVKNRDIVEWDLSPEQRAAAQAAARVWKPK